MPFVDKQTENFNELLHQNIVRPEMWDKTDANFEATRRSELKRWEAGRISAYNLLALFLHVSAKENIKMKTMKVRSANSKKIKL